MTLSRFLTGAFGVAVAFSAASSLRAQVPDGWYVVSSFRRQNLSEDGRLFFVHPRSPSTLVPPIQVTGLGCDLTGACTGGANEQGANCVLRRPSDGALIVGELSTIPGTVIDLHILSLNGATVATDNLFPIGTGAGNGSQIAQCALLPTGDVLVGVADIVSGPLGGAILGIVNPNTGVVVPVPVSPLPIGMLSGAFVNAATADAAGTTAYFGLFHNATFSEVWSVPIPGGGTPTQISALPLGVSALAFDNSGFLVVSGLYGPDPCIYRIDPSIPYPASNLTAAATAIGDANGLAMERVTGNYAVVSGFGPPPGTAYWMTPAGAATQLTFGYLGWWGAKSGIEVNPDPETYGTGTPGTSAYTWAIAPNPGGLPTVGNAAFSLTLAASPGPLPAAGFFAASLGRANLPVLGFTLLIDPAQLVLLAPLPPSGAIPLPIPNDPALVGGPSVTDGQVFLQTFHLDPGAPLGIAASEGVEVSVL
ncbi:MAG TPA: hypothetical protein VFI25_12805 [Planctomycetota bacterium]|jgi:hypothetical protein|nr:hypothetical protein [Planctomycetota bacterium]